VEIPCAKSGLCDWLADCSADRVPSVHTQLGGLVQRRGGSGDWRSRDRISQASSKHRLNSRSTQLTPYTPGGLSTSSSMVYGAPRVVCRSKTRECGNKRTVISHCHILQLITIDYNRFHLISDIQVVRTIQPTNTDCIGRRGSRGGNPSVITK